jgi:hypothetical protein
MKIIFYRRFDKTKMAKKKHRYMKVEIRVVNFEYTHLTLNMKLCSENQKEKVQNWGTGIENIRVLMSDYEIYQKRNTTESPSDSPHYKIKGFHLFFFSLLLVFITFKTVNNGFMTYKTHDLLVLEMH